MIKIVIILKVRFYIENSVPRIIIYKYDKIMHCYEGGASDEYKIIRCVNYNLDDYF